MRYKEGKDSFKDELPHHFSFYNFILLSLPTKKEVLQLNFSQSLLMALHKLTLKPPLPSLVHQPLPTPPSLYFLIMIHFQRKPFFKTNIQFYFPSEAHLRIEIFLISSSRLNFSLQVISHLTKWGLFSKEPPPHKKSLWISSLSLTFLGMTKRDI